VFGVGGEELLVLTRDCQFSVLLTSKIFAPREEKVGLGIPNPICDWVYGDKKSAGWISDALDLSVLHEKGGNMSSPTFSSPFVAARGRDVVLLIRVNLRITISL